MEELDHDSTAADVAVEAATVLVSAKRTSKSGQKGPQKASSKVAGAPNADPKGNKTELVLKKLGSAKGTTIAAVMEATGWQAH